jgi:hypothetical protein
MEKVTHYVAHPVLVVIIPKVNACSWLLLESAD